MAFKRSLVGDLVAWDRCASGAALIAQIMIMGGSLPHNFDTREFDRQIGRRPGTHLGNANAFRVMMRSLPALRLTAVGKDSLSDFFNPAHMRASWIAAGARPVDADRYLRSKRYKLAQESTKQFMEAGRSVGRRFREEVTPNPRQRVERALAQGAAVVTADAESRDELVMLLSSTRSPGKVRAYFPKIGAQAASLDELHNGGIIDLDHFGATIHAM